jgi:hypothetical protein
MASVLLPIATLLLTGYALRPREAVAPRRLALIRAALVVGGYAVVGVEVLSSVHAISAGPVVALWCVGSLAAAVLALGRCRRDAAAGRRWRPTLALRRPALKLRRPSLAGLLSAALAGLVGAELLLALVSPPNNYDSNYYHLPKIEHWVAQHSVELYPTLMRPQVVLAPGAEYLLLHLRLMTGGDRLYNLVQWAAALGCVLVASRIAAQLGAGRLGQVLAAATVAAAPVVVLEATSTQNDLVVAAWVLCTASLVVDELRRRSGWVAVLGVGTGAGLTVVTKPTGWLALTPVLLLWGVGQLRLAFTSQDRHNFPEVVPSEGSRGHYFREVVPIVGRTVAGAVAILVLAGVLAGPYLIRVDREFGSPLGPPEQSAGLALQRHDAAAILVNALRIGASTLMVPAPAVNQAVAGAVIDFAHAIHVDPEDPAITVVPQYPNPRWWPDEDHSPYPVQSALVLLATFGVLVAPRVPGQIRAYGLTVLGTLITYAAVLKWQPWGNRLVSTALLLGAPLVGWALPWFVGLLREVPPARLPEVPPARLRVMSLARLAAAGLAVVVPAGSRTATTRYCWARPVHSPARSQCCSGTSGTSGSPGYPPPGSTTSGAPTRYARRVRAGSASSCAATSGSTRGGGCCPVPGSSPWRASCRTTHRRPPPASMPSCARRPRTPAGSSCRPAGASRNGSAGSGSRCPGTRRARAGPRVERRCVSAPPPRSEAGSEVRVHREAAVGASAVEARQHLQLGAREAPLRRLAGLVAKRVEPALQPAELLLGEARPLQRGAQHVPDALEGHLLAELDVAVDEPLQPPGDPGTAVRVDHRILVFGGRLGRVQDAAQTEQEVDQLGVAGGSYGAGLGDMVGECRGRPGHVGHLVGQVAEIDELGRRHRVVEAAGARPLHRDVVQPHPRLTSVSARSSAVSRRARARGTYGTLGRSRDPQRRNSCHSASSSPINQDITVIDVGRRRRRAWVLGGSWATVCMGGVAGCAVRAATAISGGKKGARSGGVSLAPGKIDRKT